MLSKACSQLLNLVIFFIVIFLKIKMEEMEAFKQDLSIFAESFNTHGPGTVGNDLEKGASQL